MKRKKTSLREYYSDIERLSDNLNNRFGKAGTFEELIDNLKDYLKEDGDEFRKEILNDKKKRKLLMDLTLDKRRQEYRDKDLRSLMRNVDIPKSGQVNINKINKRKLEILGTVKGKRVKASKELIKIKGKNVVRFRDRKGRFVKVKK